MKSLVIILALICFPTPALAYFDAGTGSMLIQIVVGAVAGLAVFWGKIKAAIFSALNRNKADENQNSGD
jgi:hypothetical protein